MAIKRFFYHLFKLVYSNKTNLKLQRIKQQLICLNSLFIITTKKHKLEINCTKNAPNEKITMFVKFMYSIYKN